MELSDKEIIQQFIDYNVEYYSWSAHTVRYYTYLLGTFSVFLDNKGSSLTHAQPQWFVEYRNMLMAEGYRNASIATNLAVLSSFYKWCCLPSIGYTEHNLMPQIEYERPSKVPVINITAKDIFAIRAAQHAKNTLEVAYFETLISSGMRRGEADAIRWCDIDLDHGVYDYELQRKSPYVGAKINLSAGMGIRIKRGGGKARVTFISKLALKMLFLHAKQVGVSTESNIPIFAVLPNDKQRVINTMCNRAVLPRKPIANVTKERKPGFLDLDVDTLDAPESHKKKIRELQKKELELRKKFPKRAQMMHIEPNRRASVYPHLLRHFFASCQYYRNYFGNRHDAVTVRDMLGHSTITISNVYLQSGNHIENDRQWKQVMLGNGLDYRKFMY